MKFDLENYPYINRDLIKKEVKDYLEKPRYNIYYIYFILDFCRENIIF